MDDDTRTVGTELSTVRDRIGATAQELGHRANVQERARDAVRDRAGRLTDAMRDGGHGHGGSAVTPLAIALGSAAAGFLVGALLPATEVEREKMGGVATEVRGAVSDTAHEAVERGRDVLEDAAEVTRDRAAEEGRQVGEHAREHLASATRGTPAGG